MQLVPSVVGVVDIGAGDLIALADEGFKIRAVVATARFCGVRLPYFVLADGFEDEIALLPGDVLLVQEGFKLLIQAKQDVDVAVGFLANFVHDAGDGKARVQNLEPAGIVDKLPKALIALSIGCR